jgi:Phosphotransferase enzyme family
MDVEPVDDAAHGVEVPLAGGDVTVGVVRVGDTVRRPRGPWSSSVASYLQHLDRVGFPEAPRYLGIDERGRDILQFIPGDVPSQPVVEPWRLPTPFSSVLLISSVGCTRLRRRSLPPADACWFGDDIHVDMPADVPSEPPPDVISHFDVTPQNVVFRASKPVGLIDFDLSRPGRRLGDVVNTAMWWVPLFPERDRDPALAACDVPARLAGFVNAYRLADRDRAVFWDTAIEGATRSWHRMRANAQRRGGGWARMWAEGIGDRILRRRAWMLEERTTLEAALHAEARHSSA